MTKEKVKIPGDPGFSLVEVLIALATFATLSAIAVPMISSSMRNMQLSADAQNISTKLSAARLSSKSSMTPHRISFDLDRNEWSLERLNPNTGLFELQQDVNQISNGLAGSGITFKQKSDSHPGIFPSETSGTITFNTRGIPVDNGNTPTSNNIVYISNTDNDYAITVTLTGKVQVWKNDEGLWEAQK
jgi:prepilin-type N-terminal cleavage/methylation domain-containing protein